MTALSISSHWHFYFERLNPAEAVWKRIFTELAIGTPLHSRSLNGVPIFGNVATLKVFCAQSVPLCS